MTSLERAIRQMRPPCSRAANAARECQAALTKPPGSLGTLERLHVQLAGIQRTALPAVRRPAVLIVAADHGVADDGVSAYPRQVTGEMARNFARGGGAINVLAADAGARLLVADVGIDWQGRTPPPEIVRLPVGNGTANFVHGPAMTPWQALAALDAGLQLASRLIEDGADLIALGEMGIGNTTASAAVVSALSGRPPRDTTGRGTGIDPERWLNKVTLVERALARANVSADDPLGVLREVGGFEIGALAGAIVQAAASGIPVVLDGLIVGAGALLAVALCPAVRPYLIASHRSVEPGHRIVLELLELEPLMDLGLRLGEGSGAAIALHLIRLACRLPREMATFDEAGVSQKSGVPHEIEVAMPSAARPSRPGPP